jgi:hypothetical protein
MDEQQKEQSMDNWTIIREQDDPLALRLSIGSPNIGNIKDDGYIVYRGDTKTCLELLKNAVKKLEVYYEEQGE